MRGAEHVELEAVSYWRTIGNSRCLVTRASSTGRCNTIQCIDSAMLPRKNHLFGCTGPKPSQRSVPAGLTLPSDIGFCFRC
jgi:hypothetical protein